MDAAVRPVWAWPAAALIVCGVTLAPLLAVDVPALLDYPNHLARFYILAHPRDPILARMYAPHWRLVPNLGVDVIGQALLRVLPPYVGGRILLAIALLAPLAGAALYARAAFGRWTWWSLGGGIVAYNGLFLLGFLNLLLGLGVALTGAAAWRVLRRQGRDVMAMGIGAAFAACAFFCHLLGFGFFAILIVAQTVDELQQPWREGRRRSARPTLAAALSLAVALGPTAILYILTHHATATGDETWWNFRAKLVQWLTPFMTYDMRATIVSALVVVGVTVFLWRAAARATGATLALAALGVLYLISPFAIAGGTFVDSRLPLMTALLAFAGLAPQPTFRVGGAIAAAFALLTLGRSALVAENWLGRAADLAELRADFAFIPAGAKVLPARTEIPDDQAGASGRVLPNFSRLDEHLGALVVIERRAFWPLLFADPSQQPLVVRPPYDQLAEPLGRAPPWQDLVGDPPTAAALADGRFLADWRSRFDYVLVVGPPPPAPTPAGLTLIRAGAETSLYRIEPAAAR